MNRCFIVLFLALLILPLLFVDLAPDRVSVQENRMLAKHPRLSDVKNRPGRFIREFDAWFKDSTGFREQLLSLYNLMEKNIWLNGIRYTEGQYTYLAGEQGHRYFADTGGKLIPKFQGKKFISDEQLHKMADKIEEVKKYLYGKGIPLIVMFCTDKESIYPEFYPKSIKRGPEPIQLDVVTGYIREHTSADVFNIRQALLAEKNNYLLYNVSSIDLTHYTEIGAFFAYRELMKHINKFFPAMESFTLNDIDISYDEIGSAHVSLIKEKTYRKLDASFFDDVNIIRPFSWENHAYVNKEENLPAILFFCDSYANETYIAKYFAQHFGKAIFINNDNIGNIEEYIGWLRPDIVVFESTERLLEGFAYYITKIPELP